MKKLINIVLCIALVFAICGCSNEEYVAQVNGEKISSEYYNFYLTQVKKNIEQQQNTSGVENFWDTAELNGKKLIDTAKEEAINQAAKSVLIEQKARENKIKLSANQEKQIDSQISSAISQLGGKDKYASWLKENGLTEELYKRFLQDSALADSLKNKLVKVTDSDAKAYFDKDIARVKHVLIMTVDSNNQPLDDAAVKAAKEKAEGILNKAKSGEDFDSLVTQYSEDPGSKSQPDGYYLGKGFILGSQGAMVEAFETASLGLKVGEISDIVETTYGYHIIKRYKNDESEYDKNKESLISYLKGDKFTEIEDEWYNNAKIDIKKDRL